MVGVPIARWPPFFCSRCQPSGRVCKEKEYFHFAQNTWDQTSESHRAPRAPAQSACARCAQRCVFGLRYRICGELRARPVGGPQRGAAAAFFCGAVSVPCCPQVGVFCGRRRGPYWPAFRRRAASSLWVRQIKIVAPIETSTHSTSQAPGAPCPATTPQT